MGVRLHLVVGNLFNPSVQTSDAKVRQLETKVIQYLGKAERGRERFKISIDKLFAILEDLKLLKDLDLETIESINIIKGDSAIKKFGMQGANGVIEIILR